MEMPKSEDEYFRCFPWAQHDIKTRRNYTKMVFEFFAKFFPGITIFKNGRVLVEELNTIYDGILLKDYGKERKYWNKMEVRKLAVICFSKFRIFQNLRNLRRIF